MTRIDIDAARGAVRKARLRALRAQIGGLGAEGRSIDPELAGHLGWYEGPTPWEHYDYTPGLPIAEQSEAWQEYWRGYGDEAVIRRRKKKA